ncbi:MAG: putative nuclease with TOPRIM domain [Alphaproteobacteria bacterium]|jgi:predicted nuclease with TOPRIM domain
MKIEAHYPDLADAIELLKNRLEQVSAEHEPLLAKWLEDLEKINRQMRHLERIESFSSALTEKDLTNDS